MQGCLCLRPALPLLLTCGVILSRDIIWGLGLMCEMGIMISVMGFKMWGTHKGLECRNYLCVLAFY